MDNWRRKGDKCNQELARTKINNHHGKPPQGGNPNWQPSIPSWEKQFVTSIGAFSWRYFLEAKKFTQLYPNILSWGDSAAVESFQISKNDFYCKLHVLPSEIFKQQNWNPDVYIDEIDWNAKMDQNLILELESDSMVMGDAESEHEPVVIFGDAIPDPYKVYSPFGWGDNDESSKRVDAGEHFEVAGQHPHKC